MIQTPVNNIDQLKHLKIKKGNIQKLEEMKKINTPIFLTKLQ